MDTGKNGNNLQEKKVVKVLFAIPRAGFTQTEAVDNQIDMAFYMGKYSKKHNVQIFTATIGRLFVAKAREEFGDYAIKMDCDYLFMVDDDMICPPDLLFKLMEHDVDIVAPLAFQRRPPYYPVIYKQREDYDPKYKQRYHVNEIVKDYPKDTLVECDAVGFGAVLIKTEVLKGLVSPKFMSTSPSGEDILFCYNARNAGFRVYCDTKTKIEHLGAPIIIGENLYNSYRGKGGSHAQVQ